MKRLLRISVSFFLLFFTCSVLAQQYYNYNTTGTNNNFPFGISTGKTTQHLFPAGSFNQPSPAPSGNITKLYIMCSSTGSANYTNFTIKMGQTTDVDLPTSAWYTGTMTTVFDEASYSISGTTGQFFSITLETPFSYNPAQSLIIEIAQCGYSGSTVGIGYTITSGIKRSTGPLTATNCPHPFGNQNNYTNHMGLDISTQVNCSYSWVPQTSGTTSLLYSVKAVDGLVCWAAGAAGTVRKTTDGGATWTNGNPNPGVITGDIYNIEAIDANTAWCTTSPGATFIYKTTNGGTNWTQVYTVAGGFINAIKMSSPTLGIATGDVLAGVWLILGTTDGGSTWSTLSSPTGTGDGRNNCLQILGTTVWFGTGQGTLWRSTNAGLNWTNAATTGLTGQVLSVHFNNATTGLCGGATLVKTTDGGLTFAAVTAPGTGNISGIGGTGSDYWYVRGTGIYRSTDNGTTWTQVHTPVGTQNDIGITSGTNGCLVGWSVASAGNIAKMTGVPVAVNNNNNQIPEAYMLSQNYPNPFNPVTAINFSIPTAGYTELKVYDALGREVAILYNSEAPAGNHSVKFDAAELSSGIYFYTLKSGSFIETKKMALIK